VKSDSGVVAVADGMGGHDAGEIASICIVEHLKSIGIPSSAPDLRARFEDRVTMANHEIREISLQRNGGTRRAIYSPATPRMTLATRSSN
jgi:serine/threonine protein phosphatase PrpC